MEGGDKYGALRQLLNQKCSGSKFSDDDIKNLVDAGYETEADLTAATRESLTITLPRRYGKVDVLRKTFGATAEGDSPSKKLRSHTPVALELWQSFVQSAGENYREWEKADRAAKGCDVPFLKLSADPLWNYVGEILLWVRDCYRDLKKILETASPSHRFIVMGTSGIGKSYFSLFWICFLASKKEKVAWKYNGNFYLLDFSDEASSIGDVKAAKAYGPIGETNSELQKVLQNRKAWLIVDGGIQGGINCDCRILLPCSAQKKNYKEFEKGGLVRTLYMPVWEEEEICGYVDGFDEKRNIYSHMEVPDKETAMQSFELLGGVPRFVLDSRRTEKRKLALTVALNEVKKDVCLNFLSDDFGLGDKRDAVVHMKCPPSTDKNRWDYDGSVYVLASKDIFFQLQRCFHSLSEQDVLKCLRAYANSSLAGSRYGYIFELVAHTLMKRGGKFRMKKVSAGVPAVEVEPLNLLKMESTSYFKSWKEFPQFKADTYYQPKRGNLQSIDAVLHPDLLLQYFSYNQGVHGYLVQGVLDADAALQLRQYKVCSCVPKDKYDETGWQPWKTTAGTTYTSQKLPPVIHRSEQYVIEMDWSHYADKEGRSPSAV